MKTGVFPEHFLNKMSPAARRSIGQLTKDEVHNRWERGQERDFKQLVENWLNLQGVWYFTQPMNKKTGGAKGTPDFLCCYHGRFLAIELKAKGNKLEPEQLKATTRILMTGGHVCVAFCLQDVMHALSNIDAKQGGALTDTKK